MHLADLMFNVIDYENLSNYPILRGLFTKFWVSEDK